MKRKQHIEKFAKFSDYVLGHCPWEFGLVPDEKGYVKIKEFLQAVTEIEGWRHIRKNSINEMLLVLPNPPVEVDDTRIRSKNHQNLPAYQPCPEPPKLLHVCVKQKSYAAVLENGIRPTAHPFIVCCEDLEMAVKIAKRRAPHPVKLTIHTRTLMEKGVVLRHCGHGLYLSEAVPVDCFTGPALPQEPQIPKKAVKKPDPVEIYKQQAQAGSFSLSPAEEKSFKSKKKEKDTSWKNNKKRLRREKKNFWPDQEDR